MNILNDFNTSVKKALTEIDSNWENYPGLVICGTHTPHDVGEMLNIIKKAREATLPFLGICFGHQLAAIEYAINVLGQDATSEEFNSYGSTGYYRGSQVVVVKRKEGLKVGLHEGESWWNNYEVIPGFESIWKKADNFITVQYHPEYQSSIDRPHSLLVSFLLYAKQKYEN